MNTKSIIVTTLISAAISACALFLFNAFPINNEFIEEHFNTTERSRSWWAVQSIYYFVLLFAMTLPLQLIAWKYICN